VRGELTMTAPANNRAQRNLPERIGRYQVIERIGRGAMGVVYRAQDSAMGRDVAVKVLTADIEDDPDIRTRFHREAQAAARLSHPNIITIFDVGEDIGQGEVDRFFIVMELLKGATLREFLKPGDVPIARKIDLMVQLCAGLGSAHNASIYHRDIKPGNIFVRSDGILKILDFGVARLASSSVTAAGFIVGTPDYMSPEQARGENIDGRSDIFSLGGVFYFMLTGRKPFPATELPSLFNQIQSEDPVPLLESEAAPELAAIVRKMLAKKADQRYASCQELLDSLEGLRASNPLTSQRIASKITGPSVESRPVVDAADEPRPSAVRSSISTDDTVDSLPVGAIRTDETAVLTPAASGWMVRMMDRVDSTVSAGLGRLRRSAVQSPPASGARKR
jgi:eukaryotic-like serine/threonine-protein kinase